MEQRNEDLAGLFLRKFMEGIFITLHPEIMKQRAMPMQMISMQQPQPQMQSQQMFSSNPININVNPLAQLRKPLMINKPQMVQRAMPMQAPRQLQIPVPSYKMQQYLEKNKQLPVIEIQPMQVNNAIKAEKQNVIAINGNSDKGKLNYLRFLLSDPKVMSIEASPGKPIMVNKMSGVETSNVILTPAEVNEIMSEISRKTRVPISSGLFKATFDDIFVNAVVSEFVGTRFIMQKAQGARGF